jgi:hypothetical protein
MTPENQILLDQRLRAVLREVGCAIEDAGDGDLDVALEHADIALGLLKEALAMRGLS